MGLPFRSWSVIGLSSSLLLVFGLYFIYKMHCFSYIDKSLLILFFSHDLVLVFIVVLVIIVVLVFIVVLVIKRYLFSLVIFESYSHLSNSGQK